MSYSPNHVAQSLSDIPFCAYFKYMYNSKNYMCGHQACSRQIKSDTTACRCGVSMGVSGSGHNNVHNVCIFSLTYIHVTTTPTF